jgi:hypothetical protein
VLHIKLALAPLQSFRRWQALERPNMDARVMSLWLVQTFCVRHVVAVYRAVVACVLFMPFCVEDAC